MKKIFTTIIGSLFVSAILVSCGPTTDNAIAYNDALVNQQKKVLQKESVLIEIISKNKPDKLDSSYNDLLTQIKESIDVVKKMEAFDGKTDMKDAVLNVLEAYKDAAENDYSEMINLAKTPDTLYTQETDNKVIDLSKKIDDKLNTAVDTFIAKQKEFAEKYKFELNTTGKGK
jgi:hypothetical protein